MNAKTLRLVSLSLLEALVREQEETRSAMHLWLDPAVGPKVAGAVQKFDREASATCDGYYDSELFWVEENCVTLAVRDEKERAELESYAPESAPALREVLDGIFCELYCA